MADTWMIEVEDLTKRYGSHAAVQGLNFRVRPGEIVGLLGPNGAGKSTTLRILACYMPATSGRARVAGCDIFTQADEVRRRIGYMPEHNPLHTDMRVREYLKFRARLKGLSIRQSRERVDVVLEQFGLTDVARRLIGQLSKGYRQRVGLADALVHEPDLIILDEPTIGLDPHQIRGVRQLIKDLGRRHTVLISSHILPEIEMTCTRVLIMHQGRARDADTIENLQKRMKDGGKVVAEIAAPRAELQAACEQTAEFEQFTLEPVDGDYVRCSLWPRPGVDVRPMLFALACQRGWKLRELTQSRHSLEDIFLHVTRTDREEEEL
jgi:ABC-2 type transport system ATP-binding protein